MEKLNLTVTFVCDHNGNSKTEVVEITSKVPRNKWKECVSIILKNKYEVAHDFDIHADRKSFKWSYVEAGYTDATQGLSAGY